MKKSRLIGLTISVKDNLIKKIEALLDCLWSVLVYFFTFAVSIISPVADESMSNNHSDIPVPIT